MKIIRTDLDDSSNNSWILRFWCSSLLKKNISQNYSAAPSRVSDENHKAVLNKAISPKSD